MWSKLGIVQTQNDYMHGKVHITSVVNSLEQKRLIPCGKERGVQLIFQLVDFFDPSHLSAFAMQIRYASSTCQSKISLFSMNEDIKKC